MFLCFSIFVELSTTCSFQNQHYSKEIYTWCYCKPRLTFTVFISSWFAVHPVSMENTNKLISSDNKGYASYLFEKEMNPGSMMGQVNHNSLSWLFRQGNAVSLSPNILNDLGLDKEKFNRVGFGPTTSWLTCQGSTNWATLQNII